MPGQVSLADATEATGHRAAKGQRNVSVRKRTRQRRSGGWGTQQAGVSVFIPSTMEAADSTRSQATAVSDTKTGVGHVSHKRTTEPRQCDTRHWSPVSRLHPPCCCLVTSSCHKVLSMDVSWARTLHFS